MCFLIYEKGMEYGDVFSLRENNVILSENDWLFQYKREKNRRQNLNTRRKLQICEKKNLGKSNLCTGKLTKIEINLFNKF